MLPPSSWLNYVGWVSFHVHEGVCMEIKGRGWECECERDEDLDG